MFKAFIQRKISKLTKEDINCFALQNGIKLNKNELDFIFNEAKTNWEKWLYQDTNQALLKIKDKVQQTTYLQLQNLVPYYKEKYKNYL